MKDTELYAEDIYPPNPLGCEPGEVHTVFIHIYVCPFCEVTIYDVAFAGVSTELYAVGEDGTLYRRFDDVEGGPTRRLGCKCGRGFWITTPDRFNIVGIWDALMEGEDDFEEPALGLLQ